EGASRTSEMMQQQQLLAQVQQDEANEKACAQEQEELAARLLTLTEDGTQTVQSADDPGARSFDSNQLRSVGANQYSLDVMHSAQVPGASGYSGIPDAGSVLVSTTGGSMPPLTPDSIA